MGDFGNDDSPPADERTRGVRAWAQTLSGPDQGVEARKAQLMPGQRDGTVRVPFPTVPHDEYKQAIQGKGIPKRALEAPTQIVPLNSLTGIQRTVNSERLSGYLAGDVKSEGRAPHSGMPKDLPVVVKMNGKLFLHDGHHRATAALLKGADSIRARVVDLDKETSK